MVIIGTCFVAILGVLVGLRGSAKAVVFGLVVTAAIAVLQYRAIHPAFGGAGGWPWGASSLVVYVLGLATGIIAALRN